MYGESVLLVKEPDAAEAKAALLFEPLKVLSVTNSAGDVTYVEGRDYLWKPGVAAITVPAGSTIPVKTPQDLRRPAKSQPHALTHRDGNGEILFGARHYAPIPRPANRSHLHAQARCLARRPPQLAAQQLPRTLAKLAGKEPLTIALLGDSISTGCNASGWAKVAPFQPAWQDLLVLNLEARYGVKPVLHNFAVGGTGTDWGVQNIEKVAAVKPDLVILAFGMNDAAGKPAEAYAKSMEAMIAAVRKTNPDAEFILLATMLGNADWVVLKHELFPQYRDALAKLCGDHCALADLTSVWSELLKHKLDRDLTGNGVNHPNDFGHRIYAQVLSALLIDDTARE